MGPARWFERVLFGIGALALLVTEPAAFGIGLASIGAAVAIHVAGRRRRADSRTS